MADTADGVFMSTYDPYLQALIWTCKSCGFVYIGGQPKMECPSCAAYKTSFIDLPQNIEQQVREAHPDLPPNHRDCKAMRLELMASNNVADNFRVAGRVLPNASGNHMDPSADD